MVLTTDLPETLHANVGDSVTLKVAVSGGVAPYTYTWKENGKTVGDNSPSYVATSSAVPANGGTYQCIIQDSKGTEVDSKVLTLSVLVAPLTFKTDLVDSSTLKVGDKLQLSVVVGGGVPPYTYAWTKDGTTLPFGSPTVTIAATAATTDSGKYACKVTDAQGSTHDSVTQTVTVS